MKEKYEEYAVLSAQIKELTDKKSAMANEILSDMQKRGVLTEEHGVGKFTVSKLKKWSFPKSILEKEEEVEVLKEKAKSTGEAKYEESDSLRFTGIKI